MKGEQGKPTIQGDTPKAGGEDHSSEKERRPPRQRHKGGKNAKIQIDRVQTLEVNRSLLPEDAEFKGYEANTGYEELDKRIARTKAKKDSLLLVLAYPELPLHNNPAELGARQRVRKRDVSFGARTEAGVRACDTFATLAATCKKLGVSFYQYIYDRISGANRIPPMAALVTKAAQDLSLGWSFALPNNSPEFLG